MSRFIRSELVSQDKRRALKSNVTRFFTVSCPHMVLCTTGCDELKKIKQQNENSEIERREISDKGDVKNLLAVSHEFSYNYHTVVKPMKCCNEAYENLFGYNAYPAQVGRRMIGCVEKNEDHLVTMGISSSHITIRVQPPADRHGKCHLSGTVW